MCAYLSVQMHFAHSKYQVFSTEVWDLGTHLITSLAWKHHCQREGLLDLYFGLSCNRYKELHDGGFTSEPITSEARIPIPALLARWQYFSTSLKGVYPSICCLLPLYRSLLYSNTQNTDPAPHLHGKKSFWSCLCIVALKKGMNPSKPQWKPFHHSNLAERPCSSSSSLQVRRQACQFLSACILNERSFSLFIKVPAVCSLVKIITNNYCTRRWRLCLFLVFVCCISARQDGVPNKSLARL